MIVLGLYFIPIEFNYSQIILHQDVFYGSVLVYGISSWDTTEIMIDQSSGSIKRAFLVSGQQIDDILSGANYQKPISVNGTIYNLNNQTQATNKFYAPAFQDSGSVHVIDITPSIFFGTNTFFTDVMSFPPGENVNQRFYGLSLYVLIEDSNKSKLAFSLWLNDQPIARQIDLSYSNIVPIDSSKDVLYSFATGAFMGTETASGFLDGSYLYINGDSIGLATGSDEYNISSTPGTILGQFTYQNDSIFSFGDDSSDYYVRGSDCISNLKDEIRQNTTSLVSDFLYENPNPNLADNYTNPVWTTYMTYSTPCDTFYSSVPSEISICKGDTTTLNIIGGNDWQWTPQMGLSCYNCPNPIIIADSTMFYTVRIWNTDSCSKVLPVKINVIDLPPTPIVSTANTLCSDSSGVIAVQLINTTDQYSINGGVLQNYRIFEDLPSGNYEVTVTDTNGCINSTEVFVEMTFPTASFSASPPQGEVPLEVQFTNQSSGHNNSTWYIAEDTLQNENLGYTFNEGGIFEVMLVVYDTYVQCADTITQVELVEYPFVVFAPTFHADNNTPYQIYVTGVNEMTYELYNDIGQRMISKSLIPVNGYNDIWYPYDLAKGMYFFQIVAKDENGNKKEFNGKMVKL